MNETRKMRNKKKKSVLFIDMPILVYGPRFNLYELFGNLGKQYDEIRTYCRIPKEPSEERDVFGLIRVATNSGGFPTLYPSDVDPYITNDVRNTFDRKDIDEIALLSGDNGYSEVMRAAKRAGFRTTAIVPPGSNSYLLKSVVDEVRNIDDYAHEYIARSSETRSDSSQVVAVEERSEVSMAMVMGGG